MQYDKRPEWLRFWLAKIKTSITTFFNYCFLGFYARQDKPEEMWAEMFKALDKNHDGFVDIDELKEDMNTILEGETRTPEELMEETDTNGDRNVDFDGR